MNEGKIFLVNVSKGRIGEDNSSLLGGMIITKIQLAAMERVRIPEAERKDFYLYVDEFQNFVTEAFAGILSEARKYRLNLTVAHQYTAQLIADKDSSVRDAIFGNVGTMIVFRVGADDAEFLEKEFEPEFTPQDIVNLPNYKVYLKLMIDGVSSRPFSAKTLPPIVKSGDKKIEEEVIKSSRDLYCRPREVVEREINDWSGMLLGGNNGDSADAGKFEAKCSVCKKDTMVPFKPEANRPVYCKDCIAKIKSGEIKPISGSIKQIKRDEAKFVKPLADLGIEFPSSNTVVNRPEDKHKNIEPERYPERIDKPVSKEFDKKIPLFSRIKKVFTKDNAKPSRVGGENLALREVLSKTLNVSTSPVPGVAPSVPDIPSPVPLSVLGGDIRTSPALFSKDKLTKDRAASVEDMNKLKNFIETTSIVAGGASEVKKHEPEPKQPEPEFKPEPKPEPKPESEPEPEFKPEPVVTPVPAQTPKTKIKEVPEDVLRKILE